MIDTNSVVSAIVDRLQDATSPWAAGHEVIDGEPTTTPDTVYFCVYDQTPQDRPTKYAGGRSIFVFQVSCVARTRVHARKAAKLAATTLVGWRVMTGATSIIRTGQGPIIPSGEDNDVRYSAPLTFRCWLPDKEI